MPINKIQKRNGAVVDFDPAKIQAAIFEALEAAGAPDSIAAGMLAQEVLVALEEMFHGSVPTVEQIQDVVERTLISFDYAPAAKAYILYRKQHEQIRTQKSVVVEVEKTISE